MVEGWYGEARFCKARLAGLSTTGRGAEWKSLDGQGWFGEAGLREDWPVKHGDERLAMRG